MSASQCIKCEEMVFLYEKYCHSCIDEYGVAQDPMWHKSWHDWSDRENEFMRDLSKVSGGE